MRVGASLLIDLVLSVFPIVWRSKQAGAGGSMIY